MTNQEMRFTAAVAAMQGLYARDGEIGTETFAKWSVEAADALLAKLAETEPKYDPKEVLKMQKCEHKYMRYSDQFPKDSPIMNGETCMKCGKVYQE